MEKAKLIGPVLVLGMLLAFGGVTLSLKVWWTSDTRERIRIIMADQGLSTAQKVVLVQMLSASSEHPEGDREALSNYFKDLGKSLFREGLEANKVSDHDERGHYLEMAGVSFNEVSESIKDPKTDPVRLVYETETAFRFLKLADKKLEDVASTTPPLSANNPPPKTESRFSVWTGPLVVIVGIIVTFLGGLKAWIELKKARTELAKAQAPSNVNSESVPKIILP